MAAGAIVATFGRWVRGRPTTTRERACTMPDAPVQLTFRPSTAMVTGSDSGIGRAVAVALADMGLDVGVTWHDDDQGAEETAAEVRDHGRRAVGARLDTTDLARCGDTVDDLATAPGGLDVFVNNSGTGASTPLLELTLDEWRTIM